MTVAQIDLETEDILGRVEDGVAVFTLNRPKRRNALSGAMLRGLVRGLARAERDPEIRCIVLTGAEGAFCARRRRERDGRRPCGRCRGATPTYPG